MLDGGRGNPVQLGAGQRLGPYRLDALIGTGGMGQVFRATREPQGDSVALKVLKPKFAVDARATRRFLHEARAAAEVRHKHLVGVIDTGDADGVPYLVMPLLSGRTVEQRIREDGPLSVEDTNRMVAQVGAGLDALHEHDLVHRDIKASNIIFEGNDAAALMDFGLAKGSGYSSLTTPGQVVGTLNYLAPELIRGQPASASSDIYALGCVVFECLSGHPPFSGKSLFEAGMAHLQQAPADPCAARAEAPSGYGQAVVTALAKDPGARPPTATAYAQLLSAAAPARAH
jgi:serine/threonine-protein kinase